jgi:hypothetical protein
MGGREPIFSCLRSSLPPSGTSALQFPAPPIFFSWAVLLCSMCCITYDSAHIARCTSLQYSTVCEVSWKAGAYCTDIAGYLNGYSHPMPRGDVDSRTG